MVEPIYLSLSPRFNIGHRIFQNEYYEVKKRTIIDRARAHNINCFFVKTARFFMKSPANGLWKQINYFSLALTESHWFNQFLDSFLGKLGKNPFFLET